MLKAVCSKCGKIWYGWALKYKASICSCGEPLNRRELNKDTYEKGLIKFSQTMTYLIET